MRRTSSRIAAMSVAVALLAGAGTAPVASGAADRGSIECARAIKNLYAAQEKLRELRAADAPARDLKRAKAKLRTAKREVREVC